MEDVAMNRNQSLSWCFIFASVCCHAASARDDLVDRLAEKGKASQVSKDIIAEIEKGSVKPEVVVGTIRIALESDERFRDTETRLNATRLLGSIRSPGAGRSSPISDADQIDALCLLAADTSDAVRVTALGALGRVDRKSSKSEKVIETSVNAARSDTAASARLAGMGAAVELLRDADASAWSGASFSIVELSKNGSSEAIKLTEQARANDPLKFHRDVSFEVRSQALVLVCKHEGIEVASVLENDLDVEGKWALAYAASSLLRDSASQSVGYVSADGASRAVDLIKEAIGWTDWPHLAVDTERGLGGEEEEDPRFKVLEMGIYACAKVATASSYSPELKGRSRDLIKSASEKLDGRLKEIATECLTGVK
jgi:hypothetical protein